MLENNKLDILNKKFGKLTVIKYSHTQKNGSVWECICDCGNTTKGLASKIFNGQKKSCGCYRKEYVTSKNFKHGLDTRSNPTTELYAYRNAKRRCNNPLDKQYKNYGFRGIKFLFSSFNEFINHIGFKPNKNLTLDRINNNGNYEKGNIRWNTKSGQCKNSRQTKLSEQIVKDLRENKISINEVSLRFNVDKSYLYKVKKYKKWKNEYDRNK